MRGCTRRVLEGVAVCSSRGAAPKQAPNLTLLFSSMRPPYLAAGPDGAVRLLGATRAELAGPDDAMAVLRKVR